MPAALLLQFAASRVPFVVERGYSRGLYRAVAAVASPVARLLPFSIGEWVFVAAVWLALFMALRFAVQALRERGYLRRNGLAAGATALGLAGAVYLSFLVLWGLNYAREPFASTAGLDASPAAPAELRAACEELVERCNVLRAGLPEDERGVMRLTDGASGAAARVEKGYREASMVYTLLAGPRARPKPLLASRAFSYLGITGIFFPFTGEPNFNTDVPDPDLPFAIAHEVAHARGFAREDEAGYVGYLSCRFHPDRDFRYSGALGASIYALNALRDADRRAHRDVVGRRSPAVLRDIQALREWTDRFSGRISRASKVVNNAYLRSQGQREGVRSYGRMVDLLIAERRARLGGPTADGWTCLGTSGDETGLGLSCMESVSQAGGS